MCGGRGGKELEIAFFLPFELTRSFLIACFTTAAPPHRVRVKSPSIPVEFLYLCDCFRHRTWMLNENWLIRLFQARNDGCVDCHPENMYADTPGTGKIKSLEIHFRSGDEINLSWPSTFKSKFLNLQNAL